MKNRIGRRVLSKLVLIDNQEKKNSFIHKLMSSSGVEVLSFVNAHAMNLMSTNFDVENYFLNSDYLLRDGKGMEIFISRHHSNPGINMNGTDFIPELLTFFVGKKIAIYGTVDPWIAKGAEKIKAMGLNVVDVKDGFKEDEVYTSSVIETKPQLILLAMGMPKQERIAQKIKENYTGDCLIICGGAIIDFMSGRVNRAPKFLRVLGMEWLYRLAVEPRRLFKRYVIGNFRFIFTYVLGKL